MTQHMYFAPNVERTAFKIGFSITPDLRLDAVVGDINYAKTYIFECEDSRASEDFCHKFFKEFNVRIYKGDGDTEWFDISIFKVALKKVIRHAELLGIMNHFKFLEQFTPVDKTPTPYTPIPEKKKEPFTFNVKSLKDTEFVDKNYRSYDMSLDGALHKAHCQNYSNLLYLLLNMKKLKWEYISDTDYRLTYKPEDEQVLQDILNHNTYIRDSGWHHGYFSIRNTFKNDGSKTLIIGWAFTNFKRGSALDVRLECILGMVDELHQSMLGNKVYNASI